LDATLFPGSVGEREGWREGEDQEMAGTGARVLCQVRAGGGRSEGAVQASGWEKEAAMGEAVDGQVQVEAEAEAAGRQ
jgi:hypothetical protein